MSAKAASVGSVPVPSRPEELRNVVLVGHSGSGKTTLFEHLVAAAVPEHRPRPTDDERSIQMSVASVATNGVVLNLIDTPGYPDFVGELRAGLRAADAARADIEGTVALCQEAFGDLVLPLYLPVRSGPAVVGNLGLLTRQVYRCVDGEPVLSPAGPEHEAVLEAHRGPLIEAIIQESE